MTTLAIALIPHFEPRLDAATVDSLCVRPPSRERFLLYRALQTRLILCKLLDTSILPDRERALRTWGPALRVVQVLFILFGLLELDVVRVHGDGYTLVNPAMCRRQSSS
jgi:hypothetical protein